MGWRNVKVTKVNLKVTTIVVLVTILNISYTSGEASSDSLPGSASALVGQAPGVKLPNPRIREGPVDTYFAKNEPQTLNCHAEGDPRPLVTWYQNGQQLLFDQGSQGYHNRMMLGDGQLFFLRVIHTKTNRPDVGVYYCRATNIHGSVASANATVKIAVIRDDFRQEPIDMTKSRKSTVKFECIPPRGEPEPTVAWKHNGKVINPSDRIHIHDNGDLVINMATIQDAGEYVCIASNIAGTKSSDPALLTIIARPEITRYPDDVTADEGETVEFRCEISNDPNVQWGWKKSGGDGNKDRWRMLPDRTLRIESVEASDDGTYVCYAENDAGQVEAVAHLKVEYTPTILIRPHDQAVAAGRTVTLQCSAMGNPLPTIFWKTRSQDTLLFANNQKGRLSVAVDGTLRIERVEKQDEGEYMCQAINSKGQAEATATLVVRENDFRPPPVIRFGPQSQTLPQDGLALLRCQATGIPQPMIRWYKQGKPVLMSDPRFTLLSSGTLQISSLKSADSGNFTCKAVSETGETTVTATLVVTSQHLTSLDPLKSPPDLTMLPGAPEKPVVSDVMDTTVRLSWQQLRDTPSSPIIGYQVEYFAYGYSETWQPIKSIFTNTDVILDGLVSNTTYIFLVRAINDHGTGGPSPLSDLIRTLEKGEGHSIAPVISVPVDQIETRLQNVEVKLVRGEVINASAIRVRWQVKSELDVVDGFMIQYKQILNMGDGQNLRYGQTQRKRAHYRPLTSIISGLESYEYYDICVMATSGDLVSGCSPPMKIQSGESVPSSPPVNVMIHREGDSQIQLTWEPPSLEARKGEIIAYQIRCFSEDKSHNCSRSTNGTTHSIIIEDLTAGVNYNIEMAAVTEKGVGKWSTAQSVGPEQADITKEAWFIGMIVAIGCVLWLVLCVFTIWLCRSRKQRKKLKEYNSYTGNTMSTQKTQERNGNIVRKGYSGKDGNFQDSSTDSGLPAEFSTLLQQSRAQDEQDMTETTYKMARDGTQPDMKTFYQQSGPVTPYATTTLLQAQAQNARKQSSEQMFRPINQGYHQQSSGSGDSNTDRSITTDVSIEFRDPNRNSASHMTHSGSQMAGHSSGHSASGHSASGHSAGNSSGYSGDSGHLTDEHGMLIKHYRKGSRPGNAQNQPIVNWSDVLPPPPIHPPHDGEYAQDEQLYSEIPEERARSPLSPVSVSQLSACSCPVSHSHQISGYNVPVYSDNCNRCQSLRNFDNRPYSPQQLAQLQHQHGYPPNVSRTMGAPHPQQHSAGTQRGGGTPVYLHGYQQPWDCQPRPRGPYDYAQVPREDGYNYTQPIQDGLIEYSNTLNGRNNKNNIQSSNGPHIGEFQDSRGISVINTPGGPPVNYCEGPSRGQVEALNNLNNFNRNRGEQSQIPQCFDGYKIESPPSSGSASEYKVVGGGSSGSARNSGNSEKMKSSIKGRSFSEVNDLNGKQHQQQSGEGQCIPAMYRSSSETSPPHQCMIDEGYSRNADSPISAISEDTDYTEGSDIGKDQNNERDSMVANWESMEDCSSLHSSCSSNESVDDADGQFLNEEDFASAVAHAAVMSGLTVVGTTVSDPSPKPVKKTRRHHRHVRAPSPGYSTDSNYGPADIARKPYPKSQRRQQLAEQGKVTHHKGNNRSDTSPTENKGSVDSSTTKPNLPSTSSIQHSGQSYPSLYRNKAPLEGSTSQEVQSRNSGTNDNKKCPMFQFGEDLPVV